MLPELPDAKMDTRKLIESPQKPVAALLSQPHKASYHHNLQLLRLAVFCSRSRFSASWQTATPPVNGETEHHAIILPLEDKH